MIIDTSSILFSISNKKDIFAAAENSFPGTTIIISKGIMREISRHAKGRGKIAGPAGFAVLIIGQKTGLHIEKDAGYVDAWIVREWRKRHCIVCTNDRKLKKELSDEGAHVVSFTRAGTFR